MLSKWTVLLPHLRLSDTEWIKQKVTKYSRKANGNQKVKLRKMGTVPEELNR
jgi:hypothetical protein